MIETISPANPRKASALGGSGQDTTGGCRNVSDILGEISSHSVNLDTTSSPTRAASLGVPVAGSPFSKRLKVVSTSRRRDFHSSSTLEANAAAVMKFFTS